MEIFSSAGLKKNNKRFLMKEEQVKVALTKLLHSRRIKWSIKTNDKYAHLVRISKLVLAKDYSNAKVFVNLYSFLNNDEVVDTDIIASLNKESILIKHCLSKELSLRRVPKLAFKLDSETSNVTNVEAILDSLNISKESD